MKTLLSILLLSALFPAHANSGELGQKIFKKFIEYKRSWDISRGEGVAEDLCKDRNSYSKLTPKDKKALSTYWYFVKSDSPYCGLVFALQDADQIIRIGAGFALAKNCNWEDEDAVIELARSKKEAFLVIRALGECRKQKAVPMLLEILKSPLQNISQGAVEALGKIGDGTVIPVLSELLNKEREVGLRGAAALALARLGGAELSRRTAKEILDMPEGEGDARLPLMHAKYAASHVYEHVGAPEDLPYIYEVRSRPGMGTESSIATARAIIGIMYKSGMQFKDWDATGENKAIGITSLPGGAECWLGTEKKFIEEIKPLETVIGLPYLTIFRKYANDPEMPVARLFIGEAKYNMKQKDAIKILSEVMASSKSDYILNLAKDRLRQVEECRVW